jgi:hypothetical protein
LDRDTKVMAMWLGWGRRLRLPLTWGAVATALSLAAPAHAQPGPQTGAGLFELWAGSWSGDGALTTADGTRSRIRCLVTYVVQDRGHAARQDLRCASDTYRFEITSNMVQSGQSLSGDWFESTRRVGGRITGRAAGSRMDIRADGDTFTALVTVTTQENRQTFVLESPGSQLSDVSITLNRGTR